MTAPIHKTCYRCERSLPEFVEPSDLRGGMTGICQDCHLRLGAAEVARKWHLLHPECEAKSLELRAESSGAGIPRGIHPALVEVLAGRMDKIEHGHKSFEDGYEMTDVQLGEMNAALGLTKDKTYRPYCLRCDVGPRVALRRWGFECWHCKNTFGFDLQKLPSGQNQTTEGKTKP